MRVAAQRRVVLRAVLPACVLALGSCGSSTGGPPLALPAPNALPRAAASHVVVILLENREYDHVIGSRSAPYINALARRYALAPEFFAISHPSLPNYLALTSGQTFGVHSDCTSCVVSAPNLADQLQRAGIAWKAYIEGLPRPCWTQAGAGAYAKKHNPFLYYKNLLRGGCRAVVPLSELSGDLRTGRLPGLAWISPDLCHDGHDCPLAVADRFLAGLVPLLIGQLGPRGFLIVTWDEGTSARGCCRLARGGRVATIVAGPHTRRGVVRGPAYDHYSILRTVEDAFGLPHLGGAACSCTAPLDALFSQPPRGLAQRAPAATGARAVKAAVSDASTAIPAAPQKAAS
jgi:acid phosphatase